MTESPPMPRLTMLQRWQRLRTSHRFPFVLCFGLVVTGLLAQAYCYWWGVRLERALNKIAGSKKITRMEAYPASWPPAVTKWFQPVMPVQKVEFWSTQAGDSDAFVEVARLLRGAIFLERFTHLGAEQPKMRPHLKRLTQLKSLLLESASPEDAEVLRSLYRIEEFYLRYVDPNSVELFEAIAAMPNLTRLNLGDYRPRSLNEFQALASSSSLVRLERRMRSDQELLDLSSHLPDGSVPFPNLMELRLESSILKDDALVNLKNLPSLVHLDISSTGVTDAGLKHLKSLPHLRTLYLAYCLQITDEGAESLASMPNLESLNVAYTQISEKGLMRLTGLKRLRRLRIAAGSYPPPVISELRKRLPVGCLVVN